MSQIKDLTATTTPATTDILHLQIDPTGTGDSRKVTLASILALAVGSFDYSSAPASGPTLAICTDGLKDGETTGTGTGVLCYRVGTSWFRASDDSALAS